jgi:hypothetical protein
MDGACFRQEIELEAALQVLEKHVVCCFVAADESLGELVFSPYVSCTYAPRSAPRTGMMVSRSTPAEAPIPAHPAPRILISRPRR